MWSYREWETNYWIVENLSLSKVYCGMAIDLPGGFQFLIAQLDLMVGFEMHQFPAEVYSTFIKCVPIRAKGLKEEIAHLFLNTVDPDHPLELTMAYGGTLATGTPTLFPIRGSH